MSRKLLQDFFPARLQAMEVIRFGRAHEREAQIRTETFDPFPQNKAFPANAPHQIFGQQLPISRHGALSSASRHHRLVPFNCESASPLNVANRFKRCFEDSPLCLAHPGSRIVWDIPAPQPREPALSRFAEPSDRSSSRATSLGGALSHIRRQYRNSYFQPGIIPLLKSMMILPCGSVTSMEMTDAPLMSASRVLRYWS